MVLIVSAFLTVAQIILFLAHWLIYRTFVRFLGLADPNVLLALKIVLAVLSVSFLAASVLAFRYYSWPVRIFYILSAVWLGVLYFLFLAACLIWVIYGAGRLFGLTFDLKFLAGSLLILSLCATGYGVVHAASPRVAKISVALPNLPEQWRGRTAVWISDLHLGQVRNYAFAEKIARQVTGLKPDIVFIGGDLYDGVAADLDKLAQPFSRISAPQGVYFITGNHEEFADKTPYVEAVKRAGIRVLDNQLVNIDGLQLAGVDFADSSNAQKYGEILKNLNISPGRPVVLLKHSPDRLAQAEQAGVAFQISGHSHLAQLYPLRLITQKMYAGYDYGLKEFGKMSVYTSSGVGTWGPPLRVGTNSEIVQIRFE
jgi:predicted MPP superfamily phosphohydrolase